MGDRDMVKELERKAGRTQAARCGGGFMYHTQELDLGMERLFEHQSALPWTANADTAATGPKVPCGGAGQGRLPKFPPARDVLPEAILPMPERRVRPRSARGQQSGRGMTRPSSSSGNPWDETQRLPPVPASSRGGNRKHASGSGGRAFSPAPSPSGGSGYRAASADRAAGGAGRVPSPAPSPHLAGAVKKGRGRTPSADRRVNKSHTHTYTNSPSPSPSGARTLPAVRRSAAPEPPAPEPMQHPRLERRWSF